MSTTMDQVHRIREMFYQQDKNIGKIIFPDIKDQHKLSSKISRLFKTFYFIISSEAIITEGAG